ncbi:MAG: 4Fe-4S binding protein, partial [Erysipelotrichales bacterium]|nr:4Fe-4S binding protein [Erysipelotrichales bacterium]
CALGQSAPNPILSTLKHFKQEYITHIQDHTCPAKVCKSLLEYRIDIEKCKKCGVCARECPTSAIQGVLGKVAYTIDQVLCIKCGTCKNVCRFQAVSRG